MVHVILNLEKEVLVRALIVDFVDRPQSHFCYLHLKEPILCAKVHEKRSAPDPLNLLLGKWLE